jgi:hypothetical protein
MPKNRRAFLIGAGMSCEVGAPSIRNFLRTLVNGIARSRTRTLREYVVSLPESPDLEQVLTDFEHEDVWSRYLTRSERNTARQELLNGIVEILANIHYQHFKTHYGLRREHDPYFADMRRLRMVDNTRKKHGLTVEGSEWTEEARREIQLKRLNQRYPRSLDEIFPPLHPELRTVARAIGLNATQAVWNGGLSKRTKRDGAGYYNRLSVREIKTTQRELLSAPRAKLDPYHLLAAVLRPGDTVITLNYDLFLDHALSERVGDPVKPACGVNYGSTLIGVRTCDKHTYEPWQGWGGWRGQDAVFADDAIAVLKLHGSIDWFALPPVLAGLRFAGNSGMFYCNPQSAHHRLSVCQRTRHRIALLQKLQPTATRTMHYRAHAAKKLSWTALFGDLGSGSQET